MSMGDDTVTGVIIVLVFAFLFVFLISVRFIVRPTMQRNAKKKAQTMIDMGVLTEDADKVMEILKATRNVEADHLWKKLQEMKSLNESRVGASYYSVCNP